jgi:hypothetical protein
LTVTAADQKRPRKAASDANVTKITDAIKPVRARLTHGD